MALGVNGIWINGTYSRLAAVSPPRFSAPLGDQVLLLLLASHLGPKGRFRKSRPVGLLTLEPSLSSSILLLKSFLYKVPRDLHQTLDQIQASLFVLKDASHGL